jgi:hypothetical protein
VSGVRCQKNTGFRDSGLSCEFFRFEVGGWRLKIKDENLMDRKTMSYAPLFFASNLRPLP